MRGVKYFVLSVRVGVVGRRETRSEDCDRVVIIGVEVAILLLEVERGFEEDFEVGVLFTS